MKKLAIASALIASLTALVACDDASAKAEQGQRMTCVEHTIYGDILCDNRTGVAYFACESGGRYNDYSGICVMVDAEGKPLVVK